jgi:pseudouridine-5'-monophosphatase
MCPLFLSLFCYSLNVIIDTEDLYSIATQEVVSQYGKDYTWEIKTTIMGFIGRDVGVALVEKMELPMTPDEFLLATNELLRDLFPTCKLLPGQPQFKRRPNSSTEI